MQQHVPWNVCVRSRGGSSPIAGEYRDIMILERAAFLILTAQDSIKDGGLYTLWAGLLLIAELLLLLVMWKGQSWRQKAEERESASGDRS